jgi:hypothetical protein
MPKKRCHKCCIDVPDYEWKQHQQAHKDRDSRANGYRLTAWTRTSEAFRRQHPVCERCHQKPTAHSHHKHGLRPIDPGGLDPRNLVALCRGCHTAVTRGAPLVI